VLVKIKTDVKIPAEDPSKIRYYDKFA